MTDLRFSDFNFPATFDDFKGGHREVDDVRLIVADARSGTITEDMFLNLGAYLEDSDVLAYNDVGIGPSRLQGAADSGIPVDICFLLVENSTSAQSIWEAVVLAEQPPPEQGTFSLLGGAITGRFLGKTLDFDGGYWVEKDRYLGYRGRVAIDADPAHLRKVLEDHGLLMHPWYANLNKLTPGQINPEVTRRTGGALVSEPARRISAEMRAAFRKRGMGELFFSLNMSFSWRLADAGQALDDYAMNHEEFSVDEANVEILKTTLRSGRRVVCVGTSAARALESLPSPPRAYSGRTDLFISPGFPFRHSSVLLTNLHNPMGTHVIMASAFGGRDLIIEACGHAVRSRMRFGIHGDSMLVIRPHDIAAATVA